MLDDEDNNIIDDEADADVLRRLDLPKEIVRRKVVETADEAIGNNCSMLDAAAVIAVSAMATTTTTRWDATFERR